MGMASHLVRVMFKWRRRKRLSEFLRGATGEAVGAGSLPFAPVISGLNAAGQAIPPVGEALNKTMTPVQSLTKSAEWDRAGYCGDA